MPDAPDANDPSDGVVDEFLDRALRGDAPQLDELLARHPGLSGAARARLERVAGVLGFGRAEVPDRPPVERIGGFRLIRPLGSGGMGVVWLAKQESVGRSAAVKLLRPELAGSEVAAQRLVREALAVGRLDHPNIVAVHAAGVEHGIHYLAMELVAGRGLDEMLRGAADHHAALPIKDAIRIGRDVARGLACAHAAGIVHRDVKPSNVRVTPDGRALLLDFGLARDAGLSALSRTGQFRGTPHYASPEQVDPTKGPIDARTDIYSLGVTLYECVTGDVPFAGETTGHVFHQILGRDPIAPRRRAPEVPRDLETVILTAMAKEPGRRYRDAAALAADLDALLESRPIRARPVGPFERAAKWARRRPAAAIAVLLGFLIVVVLPAAIAVRETVQSRRLTRERDEVLRLSDVVLVRDLAREANDLWPRRPERAAAMSAWIARAKDLFARRRAHEQSLARLEALGQNGASGPNGPEAALDVRWQVETTRELVDRLWDLGRTIADVEARLAFALSVRKITVDDQDAEWAEAINAIASDDRFGGLEITPQVGLVPIGADPETRLQEFFDVETGVRPERDLATGRLHPDEHTGLVFVLLPPGELVREPGNAAPKLPIAPFFISKFEMTQAQWLLVTGANPSWYTPKHADARPEIALRRPVESVSYTTARTVLGRLGLEVPDEMRWEYAARAGTLTTWWTGAAPESLEGAANISDRSLKAAFPSFGLFEDWLDDGFPVTAPVGSFRPNGFGLHDILGNVWEWCTMTDTHGVVPTSGTPAVQMTRGGSYANLAIDAATARTSQSELERTADTVGIRPLRNVEP